jgi:hypothetical protein
MSRKSLAVAVVMLLAGLAPAVAIIGFCQTMPCCHQSADAAVDTTPNDCCPTITCDETPSANVTASSATSSLVIAPVAVAASVPRPRGAERPADASPPDSTRSRLAILSTLLI